MNGSESFFDRIVRTLFGNPGSKKPKKVKPVNTRRLQIEALESREMLAVGPIADVDFPVPVRCDALYNGGISRTEIRSEGTTTTNRRENLSQTLDWSYTYGSNGVTNENFKETYRGDGVATTQYTYDYEMQHVNSAMWYGGSNTSTINVNWTSAEMYCFSTTRTAQNAPLVMSNVFQFITEGYSDTTYDSYNWYLDSNGVTHGSGYSSGTHQSHDNYATRTLNRSPGYWLSYSTPQITYNKCGLPSIKTVTPSGVSGVNGVTEINVAKPNFDNFDPPKVDAILNPPQTVTVTLADPAITEATWWNAFWQEYWGGSYPTANRFAGMAQAAGGLAEVILGVTGVTTSIASAAPTGCASLLLAGGSVILIGHGIDHTIAGISTIWSGAKTQTVTSSAIELVTGSQLAGELVDAFIGIGGSIAVGTSINSVRAAGQTVLKKTSTVTPKITELGDEMKTWLGTNSRVIRNEAGDVILQSKDGLREIRFDFNSFYPHDKPHIHLTVYKMKKNKKIKPPHQNLWVNSGSGSLPRA